MKKKKREKIKKNTVQPSLKKREIRAARDQGGGGEKGAGFKRGEEAHTPARTLFSLFGRKRKKK